MDGERHITFYKPLPTSSEGKEFEIRGKVIGVYDKGKPGTVLETESLLVEKATGEVYTRAVGSAFFVGQGNWGGPKGTVSRSCCHPISPADTIRQDPKHQTTRPQKAKSPMPSTPTKRPPSQHTSTV